MERVLLCCVLLFASALARPQDWNGFFGQQQFPVQIPRRPDDPRFPVRQPPFQNFQNFQTTTTPRPTVATTPSQQYLECLQSCPSTMEYNPICGSDNQNYHNQGRLNCAVRCGRNVVAVRGGTCSTS